MLFKPTIRESAALGRRTPTEWKHYEKYSLQLRVIVDKVERRLRLPSWHWKHDQGAEGSCVGHGSSIMKSMLDGGIRYNPFWLWDQSKLIDQWADTNPGDDNGTSVSASCDVLRTQGHTVWGRALPKLSAGIQVNRWASTTDELRSSIAAGTPVSIGVNWYSNFDKPINKGKVLKDYWIGEGDLGALRGGHCVCVYGASDRRQAFRVKNSWGTNYPLVWLPYNAMQRLLSEYGEATLVTDR